MRWLIGIAALVACKSSTPVRDDCQIVLGDPAHATAEISRRYPGNPVKIAEVIERCVAPTGDGCERIAAIARAIPSMMANPPAHSSGSDYVAVCRELPPAVQHCMLPSYVLAHQAECTPPPIEHDTNTISLYVTRTGTWLGVGTDRTGRCFAARKAGVLDRDWLERQLHHYDGRDSRPDVEVAAGQGVVYQDVIDVMDTAIKTGLTNVSVVDPGDLSVPLASATEAGAPSDCAAKTIMRAVAGSIEAPAPAPNSLATAPVVIVSNAGITLRLGRHDTPIGSVAELAHVLPVSTSRGMVILQADRDTPSKVINDVVKTVKDNGYPNVMFAVKTK